MSESRQVDQIISSESDESVMYAIVTMTSAPAQWPVRRVTELHLAASLALSLLSSRQITSPPIPIPVKN